MSAPLHISVESRAPEIPARQQRRGSRPRIVAAYDEDSKALRPVSARWSTMARLTPARPEKTEGSRGELEALVGANASAVELLVTVEKTDGDLG